jgi:hypothetical protein
MASISQASAALMKPSLFRDPQAVVGAKMPTTNTPSEAPPKKKEKQRKGEEEKGRSLKCAHFAGS